MVTAIATLRWWQFLNPAIYLISVLPALLVVILADQSVPEPFSLFISVLAVILLQHAINLFNDVSDWNRGADVQKMNSWVRLFDGQTEPVNKQAIWSLVTGCLSGLLVLVIQEKLWVIAFAFPLMLLGYFYNAGKSPLAYTSMGEWVTGICYSGVFAGLWVVAGLPLTIDLLIGAISTGALAMSLLLAHQSPQIETDRRVGKLSFCVRYGIAKTQACSVALYLSSCLLILLGILMDTGITTTALFVIITVLISGVVIHKLEPSPKSILMTSSSIIALMLLLYA